MAAPKKPFIVMASHPVNGHVQPIRLVASELIKRGYEIAVLLPHAYKESFSKLDLTFVSLTGIADYTEKDFDTMQPERKYWPPGLDQMVYRSIAPTRAIFRQSRAVQNILKGLKTRDPERPIVIVQESWFRGTVPMLLRIPGLIYVPVIALGVTPFMMPSIDFPIIGVRAFPDTSPAGRAKAKAVYDSLIPAFERGQREFRWVLEDLGLEEGREIPHMSERFQLPEVHLQMCTPSLELPRTDMPPNVRFIGGVPASDVDVWQDRPEWWDEVVGNGNGGKGDVIAVTQGTMDIDYTELIIPTIEALRDRPDTVVVVVLGIRGAKLPDEINIPAHIHVIDYVPYTELLKHSTLFVTNGGYNGVQQALCHGVPILKAGNDGDKKHTGNRIEWAGCGLDLWETRPTAEQVREGVETLLKDPKFRVKALEMQEEAKGYDPIELIVKEIDAVAVGKHSDGSPLRTPSWKKTFG
ncbi:glycosyltransferase family 1 protein [Hyaloscypha variabilis F]|uniref:Glycosyltransferase family 1 protein n=1 Tax=Hyaloscypha variabilis (strain UAMH 11265 / GT02V1 / F) TaxID=1149755 RepID=A0A2J6QZ52_HYAVF|nr:glycosyltransferase family 1 protein [Hyaloscypha variabilis F]